MPTSDLLENLSQKIKYTSKKFGLDIKIKKNNNIGMDLTRHRHRTSAFTCYIGLGSTQSSKSNDFERYITIPEKSDFYIHSSLSHGPFLDLQAHRWTCGVRRRWGSPTARGLGLHLICRLRRFSASGADLGTS